MFPCQYVIKQEKYFTREHENLAMSLRLSEACLSGRDISSPAMSVSRHTAGSDHRASPEMPTYLLLREVQRQNRELEKAAVGIRSQES